MKIIFLLLLSSLFLNAFTRAPALNPNDVIVDSNQIEENVINSKNHIFKKNANTNSNGKSVDFADNKKETTKSKIFYTNEVLLNHVRLYDESNKFKKPDSDKNQNSSRGNNISKSKDDPFGFDVMLAKNNSNNQQNFNSQSQPQSQSQNNQAKSFINRFKGYCDLSSNVQVTLKKQVKVSCIDPSNEETITFVFDAVANNNEYLLFAEPKYIITTNDEYINIDKNFSSIVNSTGLDTNLADQINTREIDEFKNIVAREYSSSLATASENHMKSLRDSRNKESQTTDKNGNVVLVKNSESPQLAEDVIGGLVLGTFKSIAEIFKAKGKKLPYLYEIYKGSRIFVDLALTNELKKDYRK